LKKENEYFKSIADESKLAQQAQAGANMDALNMASNE
jgi:hypothetical protein